MPKKFSDTSKEVRQQKIYNILKMCTEEEDGLTISEIYERLRDEGIKASEKTIQRDLLLYMPNTHYIQCSGVKPFRFYCDPDYKPEYQLAFSDSELHTMTLALDSFREMAPQHLKELAQKTEVILLSKLPKSIAEEFQKLKALTIVTPSFRGESGVEQSDSYKKAMRALKEGVVIKCRNVSPYKDEAHAREIRTFSPLFLHVSGSEHYLMAVDHQDKQPKRLKICRLQDIELTGERIDKSLREKHKDLSKTIGGFGGTHEPVVKYTITCDKLMATLFKEKKIHASQDIRSDGRNYFITFEANPSKEIIRDLAGWAQHIQSVEPMEVMDELQEIWQAGLSKRRAS